MESLASRRLMLSVIIVSFFLTLSSSVTNALRPLYFVEVGASQVQLGLIMTVPSLVSLLTRVPVSTLANHLGRWRMMFFSILVSVGTTSLFAFVRDPTLFFPLVGVAALAWAVYSPVALEFVSNRATAAVRGGIMGVYFTSIAAALFIGPLLASVLTVFLSLRQLFLFSVLFPVSALVVFLAITSQSELDGSEKTESDSMNMSVRVSLSRILVNRNFLVMCVARVAFSLSMGVFSTFYPVYASENLGMTASAISLLFTFRGVTNMIIRIPAGRLSDRIGRRKPFMAAYLIIIFTFVLLAYVERFELLVVTMVLFGFGWGMRVAPSMALISESVGDDDRTLALSIFMTTFDLGTMIGALMVGFTGGILSPQMLLLVCVLIMSMALAVVLFLSKDA